MRETLVDSPRYRSFVADRDRALERIHQNAQVDLSRILYDVLQNVERLTAHLALKSESTIQITHTLLAHFEDGIQAILNAAFPEFLKRIISLRRATFIMTYASEQEAIGRATQRPSAKIGRDEFKIEIQKALSAPTIMGPLDKRVWLALVKLRHEMILAFHSALLTSLKPQEIVRRVKSSFPKIETYKRPPRALSRIREAGTPKDDADLNWFDFDFITDEDWDLAVDAYKDTELPANRFDTEVPSMTPDSEYNWLSKYNWELEQEVTEDFVRQARDGQIQAATDLGVQDFVWIAILDPKTCEDCCEPRNGLTTKEIEELDDDCDATVPPAHFNCRCQVAPVASTDEVEGPDWEAFNDWLES